MNRTRTWARNLLVGTTITVSSLALSACCKGKTEEAPVEPIPSAAQTAIQPTENERPSVALNADDPEWKKKCPDAERSESGTVTVKKTIQIYKEPDTTSEKVHKIGPGTWLNLLGAKGTWYCVDYPCDVGKLCPGWIESRYSRRKGRTGDVGKTEEKDASTNAKDASAPKDASGSKDASAPKDAAAKDASFIRIPGVVRKPRIRLRFDAGKK